jgi:hypothetical protein
MLHRILLLSFVVATLLSLFPGSVRASHGSIGFLLGYAAGPGGQASVTISDFAQGLPMGARLGLGYARTDPGDAVDARRIFINNATNGVPDRKGWIWDARLDFLFPLWSGPAQRFQFFTGPRHARFTGNFKYVGGNEDFDVRSRQWGWGAGLDSFTRMTSRTDLVFSCGVDYLRENTLQAHDTSYDPDGEIVSGREEYTYDDADGAINQPELELRVLMGVNVRLGR